MHITKAKLAKGMGYPTKSSALSEALDAAGITLSASLHYHHARGFFAARFWPPNANVAHERLYMTIGSVTAARLTPARRYFDCAVIPELMSWIRSIVAQPHDAPMRREEQVFFRSLPADLSMYADETSARRQA